MTTTLVAASTVMCWGQCSAEFQAKLEEYGYGKDSWALYCPEDPIFKGRGACSQGESSCSLSNSTGTDGRAEARALTDSPADHPGPGRAEVLALADSPADHPGPSKADGRDRLLGLPDSALSHPSGVWRDSVQEIVGSEEEITEALRDHPEVTAAWSMAYDPPARCCTQTRSFSEGAGPLWHRRAGALHDASHEAS